MIIDELMDAYQEAQTKDKVFSEMLSAFVDFYTDGRKNWGDLNLEIWGISLRAKLDRFDLEELELKAREIAMSLCK